jgi:hypothetical protein
LCRQRFDARLICPNFALQHLLDEAALQCSGTLDDSVIALDLKRESSTSPCGATIAGTYCKLGVPPRLADLLAAEDQDIALRVYILDNSGSMNAGDGHVLKEMGQGHFQTYPGTRWEEVQDMAVRQARWNADLGVPCEFVLLNSPSPSAPMDGRDLVRVDARKGNTKMQIETLRDLLQRTHPSSGTPLTERLNDFRRRLRQSAPDLQEKKLMLNIVTDGLPNGTKTVFVAAIRGLAQEYQVNITVRLCTDEDSVQQFFDQVDKEVELSLDILDDLRGEARNIFAHNPWLTYSPTLHMVREAGTLSKLLDWIDERPLAPVEVGLCSQIFLRRPEQAPYPREPDAFLAAVEKDLAVAPLVFCPRLGRMAPVLNFQALRAAVHPSRHSVPGQLAHVLGLGQVATWWFTGRKPWENEQEEEEDYAEDGVSSLCQTETFPMVPVSEVPSIGQRVQYLSSSMGCWLQCVVTQVSLDGKIMLDVKPGAWITREQQATSIRPINAVDGCTPQTNATVAAPARMESRRPESRPTCVSGAAQAQSPQSQPPKIELEYYSQTLCAWLPCIVVHCLPDSSIMIDLKPGEWFSPDMQKTRFRTFNPHAVSASWNVGDKAVYRSQTLKQWIVTQVSHVNLEDNSVMLQSKPGVWFTTEQQKQCIRATTHE